MQFLSIVIVVGFLISPIVDIILVNKLIKEKKKYNVLQVKYDDLYCSELHNLQNLLDDNGEEVITNADEG